MKAPWFEGGGEVGSAFGLVDDARLERGGCAEMDKAPDEDGDDSGDGALFEQWHEEEDGDEDDEAADEEGHLAEVGEATADVVAQRDADAEEKPVPQVTGVGGEVRDLFENGGDVGEDAEHGDGRKGAEGEDELDFRAEDGFELVTEVHDFCGLRRD